jgi:hypothetical protein
MAMKWFVFLFGLVQGMAAMPVTAAPSELAAALKAGDSRLLMKGVSVSPLGKIQGGKRIFWVAQAQWTQPPEKVVGAARGACTLIVLERKNARLTYLGRYDEIDCEYPISVRGNRVVARLPKWEDPEVNTASFTIGEQGPRKRIIFAGRESWFSK